MKKETTIIVLDNSTSKVFITTVTHYPTDDLEIELDNKLDDLGIRLKDCSWMELPDDYEIEHLD